MEFGDFCCTFAIELKDDENEDSFSIDYLGFDADTFCICTAGHHSLDGSLRHLTRQDARIVGYELAFEREPSEVITSIADATGYEFEATALHEAEPTCRITLALQLVALAVSNLLTLPLAKLPQHLQVYAIIAEFLFHL